MCGVSTSNCGSLTVTVNIAPVLNPTELSVSRNASYANSQNINPNTNGVIIGSYILQNQNSSEAIQVTSFQIGLTDANGNPMDGYYSFSILSPCTDLTEFWRIFEEIENHMRKIDR